MGTTPPGNKAQGRGGIESGLGGRSRSQGVGFQVMFTDVGAT